MTRGRSQLLTAIAVLLLGIGGALWMRARQVPHGRDLVQIPEENVLLVTIDTLRGDALGCDGGPARTPNIDALASTGVRFSFAHAHAVITLPSHASILTGTYPFQHGYRENSGYRLRPGTPTLATMLKAHGFATGAFIGAFPLDARFGLTPGFDVYDGRFDDASSTGVFQLPERPASAVVERAMAWIGKQDSKKWLAWVHVFDPHAPYRPPPPYDAQYASRPYFGEVAAVDAALAPLLDDLRRASQPTLVVVTGDHGEALGDHGEQTHGLFAYESTLRVPLIVADIGGRTNTDGGGARAFQASDHRGEAASVAARHVDILPTILEAVGQPLPADLPGRSLLTTAERADATVRASYFEAMSAMLNRGWAPLTGVLVDREKYIDVPIAERYDLAADPIEQVNLAGKAAERDRTLAAALRGFNAPPPGQRQNEDADATARLRALGYASGSAVAKARYTEADDPKTLVDVDRAVHDGVDAFAAGRAAEAIQIYQQVIARRPDMAIAYRHLAFIERQRGNVAGAIAVLQRAINAGVTDPRAIAQLGEYMTEGGQMAAGIRLLESVTKNPAAGDLDALNALGIAYAQTGRADAARAIFERVLTINPGSSVPLENLGLLALERGDVAAATQQFQRAIEVDPRSSRAHSGLGNVALKRGDRKSAADEWRRAVELDPRNFDALYNLGVTLARDGEINAARPYLAQFLRTAPPPLYRKELDEVARLLR